MKSQASCRNYSRREQSARHGLVFSYDGVIRIYHLRDFVESRSSLISTPAEMSDSLRLVKMFGISVAGFFMRPVEAS
ncbi:hypothetical protein D3C78_1534160 [compost metagenome]